MLRFFVRVVFWGVVILGSLLVIELVGRWIIETF
jgi:hypothetical protein